MGFMFLMPFIGGWKLGHWFNVGFMGCLVLGVIALTWVAMKEDGADRDFQLAVADADLKAHRIVELVQGPRGIGVSGAKTLLQTDPKTKGPRIFERNCSTCHRYDGHNGIGEKPSDPATASDLAGFGSREWIKGFITNPAGPAHFGPTVNGSFDGQPIGKRFVDGEMAQWAKTNVPEMKPREIDGVVELLVAQGSRRDLTPPDPALVQEGRAFFESGRDDVQSCNDCHALHVRGEKEELASGGAAAAPSLTGYSSADWLRQFLMNPGAEHNYGKRNVMPAFDSRIMSERDRETLVRWLTGDWFELPKPLEARPSR